MKLTGALAIVTGGASGLGAATARELASAGADVAIWDRNGAAAREAARQIDGLGLEVDVVSEQSVAASLAASVRWRPNLRVLVNCAGIGGAALTAGPKGPHPLDLFRAIVDVNLAGSFNAARLFAARVAASLPQERGERGVIVHTSSIAAFEAQVGQSAYAAAKAGLNALTLAMARDLAPSGIRCVSVAPGIFNTPMVRELSDRVRAQITNAAMFPDAPGEPADFASLVLEVCRNVMLNGCTLRLDGAMRLPPR